MEFESAKKKLMNIDRDFLDKVGKKQLFERRDKNSVPIGFYIDFLIPLQSMLDKSKI